MGDGIVEAQRKMEREFPEAYVATFGTFAFTDAANAYTSVMSGFPNTTERFARINLSYFRDLSPLVVLTYIAKNYNLGDPGTKTLQGKHTLLQMSMR